MLYITLEQAQEIHRNTVNVSGGGALGILDIGMLDSVLTHIQNDDYYPNMLDKLTHLFFSVCKFHCFQDGNKRLAITLSLQFLLINGYLNCVENFIKETENISYHVAANRIDKDLLKELMSAIINNDLENEELKLKVLEAIS